MLCNHFCCIWKRVASVFTWLIIMFSAQHPSISANNMWVLHKHHTEPHTYKMQVGTEYFRCRNETSGTTNELSGQKCHFADSAQSRSQVSATKMIKTNLFMAIIQQQQRQISGRFIKQDAQLSQRDHAMHHVNWRSCYINSRGHVRTDNDRYWNCHHSLQQWWSNAAKLYEKLHFKKSVTGKMTL